MVKRKVGGGIWRNNVCLNAGEKYPKDTSDLGLESDCPQCPQCGKIGGSIPITKCCGECLEFRCKSRCAHDLSVRLDIILNGADSGGAQSSIKERRNPSNIAFYSKKAVLERAVFAAIHRTGIEMSEKPIIEVESCSLDSAEKIEGLVIELKRRLRDAALGRWGEWRSYAAANLLAHLQQEVSDALNTKAGHNDELRARQLALQEYREETENLSPDYRLSAAQRPYNPNRFDYSDPQEKTFCKHCWANQAKSKE